MLFHFKTAAMLVRGARLIALVQQQIPRHRMQIEHNACVYPQSYLSTFAGSCFQTIVEAAKQSLALMFWANESQVDVATFCEAYKPHEFFVQFSYKYRLS